MVSFEKVIICNPAGIFTDPAQLENIITNPLFQDVGTVKIGQGYGIHAAWITSTKVGEIFELMVEIFHPEG